MGDPGRLGARGGSGGADLDHMGFAAGAIFDDIGEAFPISDCLFDSWERVGAADPFLVVGTDEGDAVARDLRSFFVHVSS